MIPINGFFEYGIMALLGGVGMVGLTIWTLASNQATESKEIILKSDEEISDLEVFQYKKAA
jgi:hypothetical protein